MATLRCSSVILLLLFGGCASINPPTEVDMPTGNKHFIVQAPGDYTLR